MGIRTYNKDHLRDLAQPLAVIAPRPSISEPEDPLLFWTLHERPTLVNLKVFLEGDGGAPATGRKTRPFAGRPTLIAELAPAIRELVAYLSPQSVGQYLQALRSWWLLFDAVEAEAAHAGVVVSPLARVMDISETHRQRALDENMTRGHFGTIVTAINLVRKAKGERPLLWERPSSTLQVRHIASEEQFQQIRRALRRGWFTALDRWQRAEDLMAGGTPSNNEEARLLKNYKAFRDAEARTGDPRPRATHVWHELHPRVFSSRGFNVADMLRGRYPDAFDIRIAFHLCLASTGWNASVLLGLNVEKPFIETHPKDSTRYLLRGYKARGGSEQYSEGLFKSQGSAGMILQALMTRTQPLRTRLRRELMEQESALQAMLAERRPREALDRQRKLVVRLKIGVTSPWLYVTSSTDEILWLDSAKSYYARGFNRDTSLSFLEGVIASLNSGRPVGSHISAVRASDFRDAFAAYAYRVSGGMILYVMKVLGHKRLSSTQIYLDNTILNEQSTELYRTFSNALWAEIKTNKRLDPTILAKCSRDGGANENERERLAEYRELRRSRIGVGCKEPTRPPSHIAPDFTFDGRAMCHVHRCMLCIEHAVIFPDSLPGLAKRSAELLAIRSRMSTVAFLESSFGKELENTEIALSAFDQGSVAGLLQDWRTRIEDGRHHVVDLDGVWEP